MDSLVRAPTSHDAVICHVKLIGLDRLVTSDGIYAVKDPNNPKNEAYFQIHYIYKQCQHWCIITDGEFYAYVYRTANNELRKYMINGENPPIPPIGAIVRAIDI